MEINTLAYIAESCKTDIEFVHDELFTLTLNNYKTADILQYIRLLDRLDIDTLKAKLDAIAVKRSMIVELMESNRNTTNLQQRNTSGTSNIPRNASTSSLHRNFSVNSLLFPIDDLI